MQSQQDGPHSENTKSCDCSSLDIFLFSNGQQYSPPRKYNLRTDELNWWGATLNYLAQLQYGSMHTSIELYTIDGKRIEGPLELSDGAAYVAVEPPDVFIQSGYHRYLIKASRSWEKRQERRSSNSALTEPDKNDAKNNSKKPEERVREVKDATSIKIIQDITIVPNTTGTAEEQAGVTVKSECDPKAKPTGLKNFSVKQVQKKKTSIPQQNPSILRKKYVNPVCPLVKKGTSISKNDSSKKKTECCTVKRLEEDVLLQKTDNSLLTEITEGKLEGSADIRKKDKCQETKLPSTIVEVNSTKRHNITQNIVKQDDSVEKIILSHSFHSEGQHQSLLINPTGIAQDVVNTENSKLSISPIDEEHKVIINNTTAAVSKKSTPGCTKCDLPSQGASQMDLRIDASQHSYKKTVVSGSQTADNFVIFVSQGDTVNLKLNIEVKNGPGSVDDPKFNNQLQAPLASNATKSERERLSQGKVEMLVDNTSLSRSYCEEADLTKSWQSTIITHERLQETINDLKVTVGQCSGCFNSEKALPLRAAPVYFDNNNYFILLPSEKVNENVMCCNCRLESLTNGKTHPTAHESELAVDKDHRLSVSKNDSKISELKLCKCACVMVTNQTTTRFESHQHSGSGAENVCDQSNRDIEGTEVKRQSTNNIPKVVNDASTQTDWSDLLLEARLREDQRYSLHMPPLSMLKLYNAL